MANKSIAIQMLPTERISVVVTVRNERDGIGPLTESLLAQSRRWRSDRIDVA